MPLQTLLSSRFGRRCVGAVIVMSWAVLSAIASAPLAAQPAPADPVEPCPAATALHAHDSAGTGAAADPVADDHHGSHARCGGTVCLGLCGVPAHAMPAWQAPPAAVLRAPRHLGRQTGGAQAPELPPPIS